MATRGRWHGSAERCALPLAQPDAERDGVGDPESDGEPRREARAKASMRGYERSCNNGDSLGALGAPVDIACMDVPHHRHFDGKLVGLL